MTIGIALSGGGARGITHLGVLKALDELDIRIHCISGTSTGALIGALYSYGLAPDKILELIVGTRFFRSLRPAWTWTGLVNLDGLRDVILKLIPENNFESLKIPLTVAATNLKKGKPEYFIKGELIPALLASCCVPVLFNPVQIQGEIYVDGGITDNFPTKPLREKCSLLIGSHCNFIIDEFDVKNFRSVIERSLLIAINGNTILSKSLCDVLIEPPEPGKISTFELSKAQQLFDIGYEFTIRNFTKNNFQKNRDEDVKLS
jgi:NTE family protein